MRTIDVSKRVPERLTILTYGASRAGKTFFMGTFPRPFIIADRHEGGWETLRWMDPSDWYEPNRPPVVREVGSLGEIHVALKEFGEAVAKTPGLYRTLGVDSLSFIADMLLATFEREQKNSQPDGGKQKKVNRWEVYRKLAAALRNVMITAHSIPGINVVWSALDKEGGDDENRKGGINLAGQMSQKSPAACNLWLYQQVDGVDEEGNPAYSAWTVPHDIWPAGGRYGKMLPACITNPSYRKIAEFLGMIPAKPVKTK